MGEIDKHLRDELEKKHGARVSFYKLERKLYGHDIASIPSLIKLFIRNTVPDVVVQPKTLGELAELVQLAYRHNIPVTPRGKATSGYGGVLPVKKGMVIDFYYLNAVKHLDKESLTVTVEPGDPRTRSANRPASVSPLRRGRMAQVDVFDAQHPPIPSPGMPQQLPIVLEMPA